MCGLKLWKSGPWSFQQGPLVICTVAEELDLLVPQQMSLTPLPGLSFTEQQFLEDVVYTQENLATLLSCLDNLLPDFQRVD